MKPTLILTAGCAGSGKSFVLANHFPGIPGVDPDKIKESLPGYDPEHPERTHAASSVLAQREFYARLAKGESFYLDGTGRNLEKYLRFVADAHLAGFRVHLLYVKASLETCLRRNAARARKVPAEVVVEMFGAVEATMSAIRGYVDQFETVIND